MIEALKSEYVINKVGGKFKLTALIQRRLLELMQGARPLVEREKGMTEIDSMETTSASRRNATTSASDTKGAGCPSDPSQTLSAPATTESRWAAYPGETAAGAPMRAVAASRTRTIRRGLISQPLVRAGSWKPSAIEVGGSAFMKDTTFLRAPRFQL